VFDFQYSNGTPYMMWCGNDDSRHLLEIQGPDGILWARFNDDESPYCMERLSELMFIKDTWIVWKGRTVFCPAYKWVILLK